MFSRFYHEVGAPKKQVTRTRNCKIDFFFLVYIYIDDSLDFRLSRSFFVPRTDVGAKRAAAIAGDELHGCGLSHLSHGTPVVAGDLAPRIAGAGCKVLGDP